MAKSIITFDTVREIGLALPGVEESTAFGSHFEGRTALPGAAHKGRTAVIQMLVDHGANLEAHDLGSRDTVNGAMRGLTWIPLDWSRGLVRVGVQSAIAHPEAEKLLVKLMQAKGLAIPPPPTSSICLTKGVKGCQ